MSDPARVGRDDLIAITAILAEREFHVLQQDVDVNILERFHIGLHIVYLLNV